jgi:hypothetical protein
MRTVEQPDLPDSISIVWQTVTAGDFLLGKR